MFIMLLKYLLLKQVLIGDETNIVPLLGLVVILLNFF